MGDILVLSLLGVAVVLSIRSVFKSKKQGGCCGNCSKCKNCQY